MKLKKFLFAAVGLLAFISPIRLVKANIILPATCQQGYCSEDKFLSKTPTEKGSTGTLYSVELESRSWNNRDKLSTESTELRTDYVYCSTETPAVMFESKNEADPSYVINFLNPGGDWFGYNYSSYQLYWATCHNLAGPNYFSPEMTDKALQLGYSLKLPDGQVKVENIMDIFSYVK